MMVPYYFGNGNSLSQACASKAVYASRPKRNTNQVTLNSIGEVCWLNSFSDLILVHMADIIATQSRLTSIKHGFCSSHICLISSNDLNPIAR